MNSTSPANSPQHASTNLGYHRNETHNPPQTTRIQQMHKQTHYLQRTQEIQRTTKSDKRTLQICLDNTYINNLISPDNSTNPKRLYSYIKNQRKDQWGIQQLQDNDGFIRSDSLTKANILNQHFQAVFTAKTRTFPPYQTKALAHIHSCST